MVRLNLSVFWCARPVYSLREILPTRAGRRTIVLFLLAATWMLQHVVKISQVPKSANGSFDLDDIITHGETGFLTERSQSCDTMQQPGNTGSKHECPTKAIVIDGLKCICDWLASNFKPSCPMVLLLLPQSDNFGVLDPVKVLQHEPSGSRKYAGCQSWEADAMAFKDFLDNERVLRVFYKQTPPIFHHKIDIVPLGPSRQFMQVYPLFRKQFLIRNRHAETLYYVNHSPTPHRQKIFAKTNKNFGGQLNNEYCATAYGCNGTMLPVEEMMKRMWNSKFVQSPAGLGEDCYRHYEIMLVGSFPVVHRSFSYPVFADLPHLPVDFWEQVSPAFLSSMYETLTLRSYSLSRLRKSFWISRLGTLTSVR